MAFSVNILGNFASQNGSPVSVGDTSSITAGRSIVIFVRLGNAPTNAVTGITVGGESATLIPDTNVVAIGQDCSWWWIEEPSVTGAQPIVLSYSGGGSQNWGVWIAEVYADGPVTLGETFGTTTTGDTSLTTTQANSCLFAGAWSNGGDLTCDDLGGGTITEPSVSNSYWYDAAAYTLDAGSIGSKNISFTVNNAIIGFEVILAGAQNQLAWITA